MNNIPGPARPGMFARLRIGIYRAFARNSVILMPALLK